MEPSASAQHGPEASSTDAGGPTTPSLSRDSPGQTPDEAPEDAPDDRAAAAPLRYVSPSEAGDGVTAPRSASQLADVTEATDAELAQRATRGEQAAAGELIQRYQAPVRSFLRRLCGRPELADDIAQDTFVRLLKNIHRYDPKHPMRRWLFTIARRLLINHARKADHRVGSTEYLGMANADNHESNPAAATSREDRLSYTRRLLDAALEKLTDAQREVVVLFHQKEMSIQDVAEVLEMPAGTVKSHLHRARAALRKVLEPQMEAIEP